MPLKAMMAKNQEQIQYQKKRPAKPNPAYASYRAMMAKNRTN